MKPKSIPTSETLFTLGSEARCIAERLMEGGEKHLKEDKEVAAIVAVPEFGQPKVFPAVHTNYAQKSVVWGFLRLLRGTHPIVALISECWYSEWEGKEFIPGKHPLPSQDPNRKEMMMINLWDCERSLVFTAQISRNPIELGEWRTVHDSEFPLDPDDKVGFEGAVMEGEGFKRSLN